MRILVFAPAGVCQSAGLELTAKAAQLSPTAHITVLREEKAPVPALFGGCGATDCLTLPAMRDDCLLGNLLAGILRPMVPDILLMPATVRGRFLSSWVAAKLNTGLTADCTALTLTEEGLLKQIRPAFGGNLTAEILCRNHRPQMASVRPGIFPLPDPLTTKEIPHTRLSPEGGHALLQRKAFTPASGGVTLQKAKIVVAGGKGIGSKKGFEQLASLAEKLGGALGATRSAVDAGWVSYAHQIGQTGVVIRPELYLAFGISGAIQHTVGMNSARVVVAVNKDRNAPIFNHADYGIVGDWQETLQQLLDFLSTSER